VTVVPVAVPVPGPSAVRVVGLPVLVSSDWDRVDPAPPLPGLLSPFPSPPPVVVEHGSSSTKLNVTGQANPSQLPSHVSCTVFVGTASGQEHGFVMVLVSSRKQAGVGQVVQRLVEVTVGHADPTAELLPSLSCAVLKSALLGVSVRTPSDYKTA